MSEEGAEKCLVKGCKEKALIPISKAERVCFALCFEHCSDYLERINPVEQKIRKAMKIDDHRYSVGRMLSVPVADRDDIWRRDFAMLTEDRGLVWKWVLKKTMV